MPSVDSPRWTTTLTSSYLAITAALIAFLGQAVPGRVWLVAVELEGREEALVTELRRVHWPPK